MLPSSTALFHELRMAYQPMHACLLAFKAPMESQKSTSHVAIDQQRVQDGADAQLGCLQCFCRRPDAPDAAAVGEPEEITRRAGGVEDFTLKRGTRRLTSKIPPRDVLVRIWEWDSLSSPTSSTYVVHP